MIKNGADLLADMLTAVEKIISCVDNNQIKSVEDIRNNKLAYNLITLNLVVIDEITRKLSDQGKQEYSTIEWDKFVVYSKEIKSDYFELDLDIIWHVIKELLPKLKTKIIDILTEPTK